MGKWLTKFGEWSAHPAAFFVVLGYAGLWYIFERHTLDWHGIATLATWLMTLVITRSEFRDDQAINAKIDELIKATRNADPNLRKLDEREPEEIEDERRARS